MKGASPITASIGPGIHRTKTAKKKTHTHTHGTVLQMYWVQWVPRWKITPMEDHSATILTKTDALDCMLLLSVVGNIQLWYSWDTPFISLSTPKCSYLSFSFSAKGLAPVSSRIAWPNSATAQYPLAYTAHVGGRLNRG